MAHSPRHYVEELQSWDLPRLEDLEREIIHEFSAQARVIFLNAQSGEGQLHALFLRRLRELAGKAVNEILEYWLRGLADGNGGEFPEFRFELPYIDRDEPVDALMLAYSVENEDGTRTELQRVPLERVLERVLDNVAPPDPERLQVVAQRLKALAQSLERRAQSLPRALGN
jgi:hypothetical protein